MPKRHWMRLAFRATRLFFTQSEKTGDLVTASYDHVAPGYDDAWTNHMRHLSLGMIDVLDPPAGATCLDLTCGTGFVADQLAQRTGGDVIGVDASEGMIARARRNFGESCRFFHSDALEFLRRQAGASFDVVTCAWGLGYTQPWRVVREIARVLKPGGRVGIIDNSLFSLAGVLWASFQTFAETPQALRHAMHVKFLPHSLVLATMMRLAGLGVQQREDGAKTYYVPNGQAALERLTATGAAAGFEFAAAEEHRQTIFTRFAELMETRTTPKGIPITHRYLQVVGRKT
ncbi:MAG: class I SAM-dependent methyltransferase [Phycisphaerae bacterium]|nr:class I SAM-dependent methyltransferase [Phycisphaerae bacterium]